MTKVFRIVGKFLLTSGMLIFGGSVFMEIIIVIAKNYLPQETAGVEYILLAFGLFPLLLGGFIVQETIPCSLEIERQQTDISVSQI